MHVAAESRAGHCEHGTRRIGFCALEAWSRELVDLGDELVDFEIELWLRRDAARRQQAVDALRADLVSVGGGLTAEPPREEISYHGVLGRAPAQLLLDAVTQHEVRWLRTDYVRFFRAAGQIAGVAPDDAEISPRPHQRRSPPPAVLVSRCSTACRSPVMRRSPAGSSSTTQTASRRSRQPIAASTARPWHR